MDAATEEAIDMLVYILTIANRQSQVKAFKEELTQMMLQPIRNLMKAKVTHNPSLGSVSSLCVT
jgi:hypothetical protein